MIEDHNAVRQVVNTQQGLPRITEVHEVHLLAGEHVIVRQRLAILDREKDRVPGQRLAGYPGGREAITAIAAVVKNDCS
jgi:hypothetical protein